MNQNARWQAKVIKAILRSGDRYDSRVWDANPAPVSTHDHFYRGYAEHFRTELQAHIHYIEMESRSESVSETYDKTF